MALQVPDVLPAVDVQLTPPVSELTEPVPLPAPLTVSPNCWSVKVAVTLRAWVMDTVQVPVPEHPPPDQPVNVDPEEAVAVRVTLVPSV